MTKPIVILSGPIGAGKSTVAHELIASSPSPVAYIEGDKFWFFIAKRAPGLRREKNFKMVMTAMTAAAVPYALYGYEVILDFSIPPWFLETAQRVVKPKDVPLDYVVLRPSEMVCAARAAARAEGAIADYAPYRELYSSFDEADRYTIRDVKVKRRRSPRGFGMASMRGRSVYRSDFETDTAEVSKHVHSNR